jgi:hypothetical protein
MAQAVDTGSLALDGNVAQCIAGLRRDPADVDEFGITFNSGSFGFASSHR